MCNSIISYRESKLSKNPDYQSNPSSSLYLSVSNNHELKHIRGLIDEHFKVWEDIVMKTERNKAREERKEILFDEHELDQEAYEQQCLYDILHEKTGK